MANTTIRAKKTISSSLECGEFLHRNREYREKSYYANARVFCSLKPLSDSEGKNKNPRICK